MQNKKIIRLAIAAMLTALSVVSLYAIRLPLIPSAPFLEYDAADIPGLIGSMLLGPGMGLLMLLAVCAIQAFTVSAASGWIASPRQANVNSVLIKSVGEVRVNAVKNNDILRDKQQENPL